jgi:nucleoside-diphosphate-sugar epimerase
VDNIKACVTGGNGFIGSHLIEVLCEQGYAVTVLSRQEKPDFPSNVRVVKGDLTSENCNLDLFLKSCDVIFHCAGEIRDESKMKGLHIDGTQKLVERALTIIKKTQQKIHWIQLSSVGVYGPVEGKPSQKRTVTEQSPVKPKGEYEITKAVSDEIVIEASLQSGFTYSIVRPSNVFGSGMFSSSLMSIANTVRKGIFFYIGHKETVATYVDVKDVIRLLVLCAEDLGAQNKVFNLSNDCQLIEVVRLMSERYEVKEPRHVLPEWMARLSYKATSRLLTLPITEVAINSLVSRSSYPNEKVERELNFSLSSPVTTQLSEYFDGQG